MAPVGEACCSALGLAHEAGGVSEALPLPQSDEDVIAWVMRTQSMTFPEAVTYLAALLKEGEEDHDA